MKVSMKKETVVRVMSMIAGIGAMAASALSSWVSEQRMKEEVRDEVQKELAKRDQENEES